MARKKVEYNQEALSLTKALKTAISFDKSAIAITHGGRLMVHTPVGIVFIPCSFELSCAVRAIDLYNALDKATDVFSISESNNQVIIAWGKKRASLVTSSKVSVNASMPDPISAIEVPTDFSVLLNDVLKDFADKKASHHLKDYLYFTDRAIFWTNSIMAAFISSGVSLPDAFTHIKDVKSALAYDSPVVNIGGSALSITFHYADGLAIKIPTLDNSAIKYPTDGIRAMFQPNLYETQYTLTEDHLDALEYVGKFARDEANVYIQPTHIGTHRDPMQGTSVTTEGLPLDLIIRSDLVSLGGFKKAFVLIKASRGSSCSFYTYRDRVTFCFSKTRAQHEIDLRESRTDTNDTTAQVELDDDLPF